MGANDNPLYQSSLTEQLDYDMKVICIQVIIGPTSFMFKMLVNIFVKPYIMNYRWLTWSQLSGC